MNSARRVIQQLEYEAVWKSIHCQIFVNSYPPDFPFRNKSWKGIVVPDALPFSETVFNAVSSIANNMGDTELVLDTWEALDGTIQPIAIPLRYSEMLAVGGAMQSHFENHLYGKSGVWGVACSNERDLSYIGGEPQYIELLATALGGMKDLRLSFLIHSQDIGYEQDFLAALFRNVEWELTQEC